MKRWIVTGGIGTGKSAFCQQLQRAMPDLALFSSDEAVHQAYNSAEVRAAIATGLGLARGLAAVDASAFRAKVREIALASLVARKRLEQILHPFVWEALKSQEDAAAEAGAKVLVAEVPLYYETARAVVADKIVVLAASQAVQLNRVQARPGVGEATALAMLKMQLPLSEKVALADMVVWNDGSLGALEQAAITLLRQVGLS